MSEEFTTPFPVVSPMRMAIGAETVLLLLPAESLTLVRLTVIRCALVTPVRSTTYSWGSEPISLPVIVPVPLVTLAPSALARELAKIKIIV
jgi:hypothetical protein